jgi:hypothetical protein
VTRLLTIALVASTVLVGCGPFTMPFAPSSHVSVAIDGNPGFVSFGGFRWQVAMIASDGTTVARIDPSGAASIAVAPGDYRLDISAIPTSDVIMCADPARVVPGTCMPQEGPAVAMCVVPITVPPLTDVVLSFTVVNGTACLPGRG